jgi:hypothetical protein
LEKIIPEKINLILTHHLKKSVKIAIWWLSGGYLMAIWWLSDGCFQPADTDQIRVRYGSDSQFNRNTIDFITN